MKQVFYSEKYDLRFYHAPKNAMTSMIRILGLKWYNIDDIPSDTNVYAVIRDPFDRFVSAFLQTQHSVFNYSFRNIINPHLCRNISKDTLEYIFKTNLESVAERYVNEIKVNGFFDNHQLPQDFYFNEPRHGRENKSIDVFLNFDTLHQDLVEKVSPDITNLRLNAKNLEDKKQYTKLFSKYRDEILEMYHEDNVMFEEFISNSID